MARVKKPKVDTKDITIPVELWNGTTFRNYIQHLHNEKGIHYIHGKTMLENQWIKQMVTEYGNEKVKEFMELCVKEHKVSDKYPTVTVYFMKHFLLQTYMPRVLNAEVKKTRLQEIRERIADEQKDVEEYF